MTDEGKMKRQAEHIWHVWMNQYSNSEEKAGREWPHSLYKFKSLLNFMEWGWKRLQDAFTGALPKTHQQCSHQPVEAIKENKLRCCLGQEVTTCAILLDLKKCFDEERNRECGQLGKFYAGVPDEQMFRIMANTCAWHIYKKTTNITEGFHGVDTSEGHLMDEGDRMYWSRLYENMAATDEAPPE